MKKHLKFLAMALCLALVISVCACLFAANTEADAAEYRDGEWVTVGTTFKFDGKDYTVQKDTNFSGEYIIVDGVNYYLLSDSDDFKTLSMAAGEGYFILANDINLGVWTEGIWSYFKLLEGCGHTLTLEDGSTQGAFSSFAGIAKNIVIEGSIVASSQVGAFAATFMDGEIHGVVNNADVSQAVDPDTQEYDPKTEYKLGGIIGAADLTYGNFLVQNCVNNGDITGRYRCGGIIGNLQTNPWNDTNAAGELNVIKCENNGNITASDELAGGIISVCEFYGTGETNIIGCTNNGTISSKSLTGGIVSLFYSTGEVEGCINNGDVSSSERIAGGILADIQTAENGEITVSNCANFGALSSGMSDVGGVIGRTKTGRLSVTNCVNFGELTPGVTEAVGETPAINGVAYGIMLRQDTTQAINEISNCYYINADRGMNKTSNETDRSTKLSAEQVENNYVLVRFNSANESSNNPIRWKLVDGKPAVDLSTIAEIGVEAIKPAVTTTASTTVATEDKTSATTKAPVNAQTTEADDAEEEKSGCGSSLTVVSVLLVSGTLAGAALAIKRKKD